MISPPNESIQSLIFRRLRVYGVPVYSCVLGINGYWHSVPAVPESIQYSFEGVSDTELLAILRRSGLAKRPNGLFDDPSSYLSYLLKVFSFSSQTSGNTKKGKLQITYCDKCVAEAIECCGFGYFKAEWLYSDYCETHKKKLQLIPALKKKEALVAINKVLSGELYEGASDCRKMDGRQHTLERLANQLDSVGKDYTVRFMPCLIEKFYHWLGRNIDQIFRDVPELQVWLRAKMTYRDGRYKAVSDGFLIQVFDRLEEQDPDSLKYFLDKHSVTLEHKFGFRQPESLSESFTKCNSDNCDKCLVFPEPRGCSMSLLIEAWSLPFHGVYWPNFCDYFLQHNKMNWDLFSLSDLMKDMLDGCQSLDWR